MFNNGLLLRHQHDTARRAREASAAAARRAHETARHRSASAEVSIRRSFGHSNLDELDDEPVASRSIVTPPKVKSSCWC